MEQDGIRFHYGLTYRCGFASADKVRVVLGESLPERGIRSLMEECVGSSGVGENVSRNISWLPHVFAVAAAMRVLA